MNCKNCGSDRIMFLQAHSKDLGYVEYMKYDVSHDGYFPDIPGVCGGDDAAFNFCLECGTIQSEFPISDDTIKAAFVGDVDEDEAEELVLDDWGQIKERETPPPDVVRRWACLIPSSEEVYFETNAEFFKFPSVKAVSKKDNFKGWITTIDPIYGRIVAGLFIDEADNLSVQEVAIVNLPSFTSYREVDWTEYNKIEKIDEREDVGRTSCGSS